MSQLSFPAPVCRQHGLERTAELQHLIIRKMCAEVSFDPGGQLVLSAHAASEVAQLDDSLAVLEERAMTEESDSRALEASAVAGRARDGLVQRLLESIAGSTELTSHGSGARTASGRAPHLCPYVEHESLERVFRGIADVPYRMPSP